MTEQWEALECDSNGARRRHDGKAESALRWSSLLVVASALLVLADVARAQTIQVEWERPIVGASSASAARPNTETFVVANPQNPDHWVAVAMQPGPETMAGGRCVVFTTRNGGQSWHESALELADHCGDPWLAFSSPTTVLFSALANMGELKVLASADGGTTWTDPQLALGRGHDHPVLTSMLDSSGRPHGAYVVSSRAQREGGTTRFFAFISRLDSAGHLVGERVLLRNSGLGSNTLRSAVLSDGTLVAPFIDYLSGPATPPGTASTLERRRVWAYRSDGSGAFPPPLFITDHCGSARGFGELASDQSRGAFRDRLYFVCFRHDGVAAVVARSEDRGERWTMSTAFDVPPAQPPRLARTLSIAVGPDGTVGLSWYDRRDDAANVCQHLLFATSVDGGLTFTAPVRISSAPSCPSVTGNRNGWTATRWQGGGDYSGLAALPDGRFVAVWADSRSGVYQPYAAVIRVRR